MSGRNHEHYNKTNHESRYPNNSNNSGIYGDNYNNSYRSNRGSPPRRGHYGQSRGHSSTDQGYQNSSPRPSNNFDGQDNRNFNNRSNARAASSPYNRISQSRSRNSHTGSSAREERENPRPLSFQGPGGFLAGWEEPPMENFETSRVPSTDSSTVFENTKAADDDEVDWVISEPIPSNSVTIRTQSPPPYFFSENEVNNNKKVSRNNNKGKSKAPQDQCYEEKFPNNGEDDYKGKRFPPPYPIVPVSPDIEQHSSTDRIFENDSRSSAQSFDNLCKIANSLWNVCTDVPLDLASKQDVNPDEYLRLNGDKLREASVESSNSNNKNHIEPEWPEEWSEEWPEERDFSNMTPCNPELTYNQSSSFIGYQSSSFTDNQSSSFIDNQSTSPKLTSLKSTSIKENFKFVSRSLSSYLPKNEKSERRKLARNPPNDDGGNYSTVTISTKVEISRVEEISTKVEISKVEEISTLTSLRAKDEEAVRDLVDNIFHAPPETWLLATLAQTHILLPKISSFDERAIQNLLKILSSPLVLNKNNTNTKKLINYVIAQAGFFEKIFSYMKGVNFGSDLIPIIRLIDFIIRHFPRADLNIQHSDIDEVYMRVKSTFLEKESDDVTVMLSNIKRYRPKKSIAADRNVVDQNDQKKAIEQSKDIEQKNEQKKALDCQKNDIEQKNEQKILGHKKKDVVLDPPKKDKEKPKKPDWIIHHSENRIEKPIEPLSEDIFNLREMMIRPTLTPHLANRSWSPEHEEIYRQIHYDLLRTEVVEDLQRASVSFFADNCKDYDIPMNSPFYNYVYYQDVQVVDTYIDKNFTPYVRVGFKPSRPVDWIKGEHLIYGTYVLLFKVKTDLSIDISSMTWAMVGYFNLDDVIRPSYNKDPCWKLRESFVGLNFSSSEFEKLDIDGKYVMLESTRNYATIRPVMEWLKESGIQRFIPLYRELFTCSLVKENNENKLIPGYLENVSFDITSILVDQKKETIARDLTQWPNYLNRNNDPAYNMERSGVVALRHIISNKVAVIMAPIITSKARVASKAVELLNQALEQSHCHEPILILTRSSYALDSILEQLLPSFPELIRCGSLSKCKNPALSARQIQDVVEENSKKTSLRRGWYNISGEIISKQKELMELWRLRKYGLSLHYFLDTCPKGFREQLSPVNSKTQYRALGFETEKAMLIRCLELWLSGIPVVNAADKLHSSNKQKGLTEDFPAFPSFRHSIQRTDTTLPANPWSNVIQGSNQEMYIRPYHISPSLFDELSKSYLFENDWMKSNGCNDDEISFPTDSDKEILNHQIDDRVIFKPEECYNSFFSNSNFYKHKTEFANVAIGFWSKNGKTIWDMKVDERKSLYDKFCQRHKNFCDPKIRDIQKSAIIDAENAKSTLIARWTEVCSFVPVIGMTVNYATAYRELLTTIKPRICIVDEASEILESQLMYLISSDRLEHLIMFGDTKYSKPDVKSCTAQKHGLDVSLFDRWIQCDGKSVCLKQQSRMHPAVHELVRTFYEEDGTENIVTNNIPKIRGVPSNVYFMTHNNSDDEKWTSFKKTNTFEAEFIIRFAFYLYQQGYDPAKITILTPYLGQKLLILNLLKPELKKDLSKNSKYGRFDKERNQAGKIRVELIDNYSSEENEIVLLSLVSVSKNWHEEALKTLNNKKRAIIALSRALHALYIFGNDDMLRKSEIWAPIVKLTAKKNAYGKSLILSCDTHKQRIEVSTLEDFETKVPYGGCSKPCDDLLKCGHACSRKCHPIQHSNEVNYICLRPCAQSRPEGCSHKCPNKCYECEKLGKCPPCEVEVRIKLSCGHVKIMSCRRKFNMDRMNVECSERRMVTFKCGHRSMFPCSTRYPVCQETCGKPFPCGHRCQRQCGIEHNHERSDCLSECTKVLICGHQCANGCNEPNRHTSFCSKRCRIKCLHGRVCPKTCYEKCTSCREPCPWKCPHYKCNRRCFEVCDRIPCDKRCQILFGCGHQCNGYCGEKCPPCLKCNPNLQCKITLLTFSEMEENEDLYVLPECNCVFTATGLDSYFNNQAKNGDHTAVKLWQCPSCQEPIFTAMRYSNYLKSEINLWNIIKHKQEIARNSLSEEERRQIINAMNEETRTTDFNSMVGGRWFVCPNKHPYYIGNCGGATQVSKCPDCSATIGGTQHRVINSNRFYGEFDNSTSPAWPGQH